MPCEGNRARRGLGDEGKAVGGRIPAALLSKRIMPLAASRRLGQLSSI